MMTFKVLLKWNATGWISKEYRKWWYRVNKIVISFNFWKENLTKTTICTFFSKKLALNSSIQKFQQNQLNNTTHNPINTSNPLNIQYSLVLLHQIKKKAPNTPKQTNFFLIKNRVSTPWQSIFDFVKSLLIPNKATDIYVYWSQKMLQTIRCKVNR